jgi:hypothetical protein
MSKKLINQIGAMLSSNAIAQANANIEFDTQRETLLKTLDAPQPATTLNPAVERCERAWRRAYKTALAAGKAKYDCGTSAKLAYRKAMPTLDSYNHVRDFIACTTYALLLEIINEQTATKLLYAAQVASAMHSKTPTPTQQSKDVVRLNIN